MGGERERVVPEELRRVHGRVSRDRAVQVLVQGCEQRSPVGNHHRQPAMNHDEPTSRISIQHHKMWTYIVCPSMLREGFWPLIGPGYTGFWMRTSQNEPS